MTDPTTIDIDTLLGSRGISPAAIGAALNPIVPSKAVPLPWEDFDRPEGTLVQGMVTKSGHTFTAGGGGAVTAFISKNGLVNTNTGSTSGNGNVYIGFTWDASTLLTEVWGVTSFEEVGAGGYGAGPQAVLMFNNGGPVDLAHGLIHCEFKANSVSLKVTTDGAGNLVSYNGTVTEINGGDPAGIYRLKLDGTRYLVGMTYAQKATAALDELYVHLPDGRVWKCVGDTNVRTVMATCFWGTAQIQTPVANGWQPRWHALHYGPRRSNVLRALGGAARDSDMAMSRDLTAYHRRRQRIAFNPTAIGWYAIANAATPSVSVSNTVLGGLVRLSSRDGAGRQSHFEIVCGIEATDNPRIERVDRPYGTWASSPIITRIRLSRDATAGGVKQLEVYVAVRTGAADMTFIDLDGQFEPIQAPVVGSSALTGSSREQYLNIPRGPTLMAANNADATLTPGVDNPRQLSANANSATRTISLDDSKAIDGDFFIITRTGANAYNVANLSDGVVLKSLAQNTWARFDRYSTGKFVLSEYGAL